MLKYYLRRLVSLETRDVPFKSLWLGGLLCIIWWQEWEAVRGWRWRLSVSWRPD